jgi:hypothetical protein
MRQECWDYNLKNHQILRRLGRKYHFLVLISCGMTDPQYINTATKSFIFQTRTLSSNWNGTKKPRKDNSKRGSTGHEGGGKSNLISDISIRNSTSTLITISISILISNQHFHLWGQSSNDSLPTRMRWQKACKAISRWQKGPPPDDMNVDYS